MKSLQQIFRISTALLLLLSVGVYGQKQTKTYKESFKVGKDAVIDINTSYADIEFETWDKDEVVVEATVELDGATDEEAADYFEEAAVEIKGNSREIEISTNSGRSWAYRTNFDRVDLDNFVIEIPELPELEPLFLDLEIPELPELMEMPPIPFTNFDYNAYKEEGEEYMQKWQKEFSEQFDEDYRDRMEQWAERIKERAEVLQQRREEREERRQELLEQRNELRERAREERERVREERDRVREERDRIRDEERRLRKNIIISQDYDDDGPNVFYRWSDGAERKYKVKKKIKIRMPKSARLKMNVRHGEVKLAENTRNIDATLSYTRLLASSIGGDKTSIIASHSPVSVRRWDYGKLKTDFSDDVKLDQVRDLVLYSNSSDVRIEELLSSAQIRNNLGVLQINSIADSFKDMDISIQYGELFCELPSGAYRIYVDGTSSKLSSPAYLVLDRTKKLNNTVHRGYHLNKNTPRSINIRSEYSDVVLED
ncbi:DUF4097 family beta strand repeat-containing protein [Poritiphilus flavus]|uniref:DUF4097 family beta strand repeat protein n=1 Tax=Poritiphilus flavus TaxID=2697053 RepID=A0A6L9E9D8_9FLAO|nr:DUF4097 family beta strand repeat-containing protein [Poritiphilus flavus]NAS11306.1 DUF4097 family beta strand repeat protein [Poritiphilus flavus]